MSVSINDIENREQLLSLVFSELKQHGVKWRKEPAAKPNKKQDKISYGKIFYIPLHYLDSVDVHLSGIGGVKVPTFVVNSCRRILEEVSTLGLFRKTGSANRQKEIILRLERGLPFEESDNVIDIACILKTFFRSLPEPLIPPGNVQETLIRGLLNEATAKHCTLLTCLLLPPLVLNTLAYFCQFLSQVALYSDTNKMTVSNLAIILAPSIMPVHHNIQQRHNSHVRIIQLLIENSAELGVVPEVILDQLQQLPNVHEAALLYTAAKKTKKKRRSGSLTRMFNGFRKIVGALGSSNESLEERPVSQTPDVMDREAAAPIVVKSTTKKRRVNENPFSARKKKDLLSLLPEGSALLPNTPAQVPGKSKKRISLGIQKEKLPLQASESMPSAMDRRWSLVGAPWPRKKTDKGNPHARLSPVVSLPSLSTPERRRSLIEEEPCELSKAKSEEIMRDSSPETSEVSLIQVPRSEYEAIKTRVEAIESKISEEFDKKPHDDSFADLYRGPEGVAEKFQRTLDETTPINSVASTTDQLAKRLSRELKIRRSTECRSPSARKIGTIRRRSRENGSGSRLSRSTTWHVGTTSRNISEKIDHMSKESLCLRSNLKRGRPNTVLTGLRHPSPIRKDDSSSSPTEKWVEADKFFADPSNDARMEEPVTPVKPVEVIFKTPILPPSSSRVGRSTERTPRRYVTSISVGLTDDSMAPPPSLPPRRTPRTPTLPPKSALSFAPHAAMPDIQTGRASIARIRSQNAGHVAAKARLFDNMATVAEQTGPKATTATTTNSVGFPKNSNNQHPVPISEERRFLNRVLKENTINVPRSSPRKSLTPRTARRQQVLKRQKLRLNSPSVVSPIGASKRQRKQEAMLALKVQEIKRRRVSELQGALPGSVENRTPTKRALKAGPMSRKSPRFASRR